MNKQYRKQKGFTLMEVVAVVAVSGTLAAMSMPMVQDFQSGKSASAVQDAFVRDINTARETAVSQGATVSICPSSDGVSCSTSWSNGWIVYRGAEGSEILEQDIIQKTLFDKKIPLALFNESPKAVNYLQFDEQGYNTSANRLTATFCFTREDITTLSVERTGRVISGGMSADYKEKFLQALDNSGAQCNRV